MLLRDYLNTHFNDTATWTLADMESHFMLKFGVNVRNEGSVYCFKYNQLESNWAEPLTALCRGIMLRYRDGSWTIVSRPFDKFFNYGEPNCPYSDAELFGSTSRFRMIEKADGTCIQMWYDHDREEWRVSTLKMITPGEVNQFKKLTFHDLFWNTVDGEAFANNLRTTPKDYTFIFELCCPENQVVTRYETPRVYLLAVRNHQDGDFLSAGLVDHLAERLKVLRPVIYPFTFANADAMLAFVEAHSEDHDTYGEYPEGFVVLDQTQPACKLKNDTYLRFHACITGDIKHTFNAILKAYFTGKIDDIESVLSDMAISYLGHLRAWWTLQMNLMTKAIADVQAAVAAETDDSQKAYALCIQSMAPKSYIPFFYQFKDNVRAGNCDAGHFEDWFMSADHKGRLRYTVFEKQIKAVCEAGMLADQNASE